MTHTRPECKCMQMRHFSFLISRLINSLPQSWLGVSPSHQPTGDKVLLILQFTLLRILGHRNVLKSLSSSVLFHICVKRFQSPPQTSSDSQSDDVIGQDEVRGGTAFRLLGSSLRRPQGRPAHLVSGFPTNPKADQICCKVCQNTQPSEDRISNKFGMIYVSE